MMKTRKAILDDAEEISRIVCLCYEDFGETDDYPNDVVVELKKSRGSMESILKLIEDEHVFVVEEDGCIEGMVSIKGNEITKLYIDPEHQSKGIGRMLFSRAESLIRSHGFPHMFLGAAGKTMVRFYRRLGMRIARRRIVERGPCVGMTVTIFEKTLSAEEGDSAGTDKPHG